ncbi:MAG: PEP/pyruvate-binding domain-containing protein, partial [Myxococcota bacterium]|nr:PEP/pyruvate-binding domain-containing protein [Myxococcota bacterium]
IDPALQGQVTAALDELGKGPFAVRSSMVGEDSAEHSFAGQLESFLFQRNTEEVCKSIQGCWASGFGDRALAYHLRANLPLDGIRVAVVVQRMIDGEVSGVLFTANPVNGRRDEALLTAAWGQGEGVVSGLCNTDEFIWRHTGEEVSASTADKDIQVSPAPNGERGTVETEVPASKRTVRCLTPDQVNEICQESIRVSNNLGSPQDIEWTIAAGELYFVQSRPITSLPPEPNTDGPLVTWDNSNIQESFNGVTAPLTFSFAERAYASVYRQTMVAMRIPAATREAYEPIIQNLLGLIHGRLFYNINNWYEGLKVLPSFGRNKADMEKMMGLEDPVDFVEDETLSTLEKLKRLPALLKIAFTIKREFSRLHITVEEFHSHFWETYRKVDRHSASTLTFSQLMVKLEIIEHEMMGRWHTPIVNDFFVMMTNGSLSRFLSKKAGYDDPVAIQNNLLAGEEGIESAEPTRYLMRWAKDARDVPELVALFDQTEPSETLQKIREEHPDFGKRLDDYIELYGDRMMGEQKLEETSLREDSSFLINVVRNYMALESLDPDQLVANEKLLREQAEAEVRGRLGMWSRWRFQGLVDRARQAVKNRENMRMNRSRMFGCLRDCYRALGNRLYDAGKLESPQDIYYLTMGELESYHQGRSVNANLGAIATTRKQEFADYESMDIPHHFETQGPVYHGNVFQYQGEIEFDPDSTVLMGTGCYPGIVESDIRLIFSPKDELSINGKILVTVRTDPGWAPLFPTTNGIIVERGSTLSHSAVVARELGIPAIVGIPGLTEILQDGEHVKMDGQKGTVTRQDAAVD